MGASSKEALHLADPSEETKYYEVLRCIDGIPLFEEDHLDRLQASVQDSIRLDRNSMKQDIRKLIRTNGITDGNIKIVLTKTIQLLFASHFYYPTREDFLSGINVGLLQWKRMDPNVKMVREDYKHAIAEKLAGEGPCGPYFETLLVDDGGFITEGSRSNVFFVKGEQVFTAPDSDILKGITRKYVLEAIREARAVLVTAKLSAAGVDTLREGGAAFLSGTSIGVLPVCAIEEVRLPSSRDPMVLQIMKEYEKIIQKFLTLHKNIE
jgi:branched-chain amino acid aminotransferase